MKELFKGDEAGGGGGGGRGGKGGARADKKRRPEGVGRKSFKSKAR